ncbi:MAG: M1 family metallopeptidase [Pyrinomonadaceae bacterium]
MKQISILAVILTFVIVTFAQRELGVRPTETGGPLMYEQAAYDVQAYDVALRVDPKTKSISGTTVMTAKIVIPTNVIVLDLDTPYTIDRIYSEARERQAALKYERREGKIWIYFPMTKQVGEMFETIITYSGTPRVAPRAPWIGGFMWEKTPNGADWVSIALQNDGVDLLFPVKDHPSDKASTATMRITVPEPLVAVGPGKLESTVKNPDGTSTYIWRMTNPIPNYSILFDAAPYRVIKDRVKSITGEMIPIEFYILPESFEKGPKLIEETKKYNAFFEKYLGPFPFRSQKLGIVETPHLGMEHSTHIAYGNKFNYNADGFDWLMLHEFGHEWWSNLVTASDWRDFWIHEGFQSFMDALYLEEIKGKEAYMEAMRGRAKATRNMQPVAPREPKISYQVYMAEPDYLKSDGDIYGKGSVILHSLRYLIGDDAFFRSLRRMCYPTKAMESVTDGRQTRLVNTDDFLTIAEQESKMELDWFFELYLRQPKLPKLIAKSTCYDTGVIPECIMALQWETPNNLPFPMPIDVEMNGKTQRVEMKDGKGAVSFTGTAPVVDPKGWVLKAL